MDSSKNKGYTAADLERYHSGKMPAAEMHALEKAAMDDPFLADALEGYQYTSTASADLMNIRKRLEQKTANKKAGAIMMYSWMKIAAVIAVVAGGGWLAFSLVRPSAPLAVQNEPLPVQDQNRENTVILKTDSVQNVPEVRNNISLNERSSPKQKQDLSRATGSGQNPASITSVDESNPVNHKTVARQPVNQLTKDSVAYQSIASAKIAEAHMEEARSRNNMVERQQANRVMPDLNANNRQRSDGYVKTDNPVNSRDIASGENRNLDTIRNIDVVMKKSDAPPAEVVILSSGNKESIARRPKVIIDTLEPAEGWARFDDYIAANIKAPEELKTKSMMEGEVQLSFDVDKKGQPVNIAVIKSLCEKCDEEAIRLLKEGPRWKKNKNKKGKITIRF